jgi:tetratricopeptide (TPR) repeat protein
MIESVEPGPEEERTVSPEKNASQDDTLVRLFANYSEALEDGRMADAETTVMEVLALAAEDTSVSTNPDLALRTEAHRLEDEADWPGAEAVYRKILALPETATNHFLRYHAHTDLSALHSLLGRHETALEDARAATHAARCEEMRPLLFTALETQARCALRRDQVSEALTAVAEVLQKLGDGVVHDLERARVLVVRAACRGAMGDWTAAEKDLQESWKLLEPQAAAAMFAGVHSGLARWWAVTAKMRVARGDGKGSARAWRDAVERCRHVATLPQLEGPYARHHLAQMLHALGRALESIGNSAEAESAFTESRAIRQAIGLPPFGNNEETVK